MGSGAGLERPPQVVPGLEPSALSRATSLTLVWLGHREEILEAAFPLDTPFNRTAGLRSERLSTGRSAGF